MFGLTFAFCLLLKYRHSYLMFQRAAFRDVENWIVNGEKPYESVRMKGAVLECTTFATLRLLEELREVLGDGFHSSLKVFPVIK